MYFFVMNMCNALQNSILRLSVVRRALALPVIAPTLAAPARSPFSDLASRFRQAYADRMRTVRATTAAPPHILDMRRHRLRQALAAPGQSALVSPTPSGPSPPPAAR